MKFTKVFITLTSHTTTKENSIYALSSRTPEWSATQKLSRTAFEEIRSRRVHRRTPFPPTGLLTRNSLRLAVIREEQLFIESHLRKTDFFHANVSFRTAKWTVHGLDRAVNHALHLESTPVNASPDSCPVTTNQHFNFRN